MRLDINQKSFDNSQTFLVLEMRFYFSKNIESFFANLQDLWVAKLLVSVTPQFLLNQLWCRKIIHYFQNMNGSLFGQDGIVEMNLKEIKRHRQKLDDNYPTDFLGIFKFSYKRRSVLILYISVM